MYIRDLIPLSFQALLVNKRRSLLTMLGIVIGISSVILMISVGQAAERYLLSQIASFGSDLVFIANGHGDQQRRGPPDQSMKLTLTIHDYETIKNLSWVKSLSASVVTSDVASSPGVDKITHITGTDHGQISVFNMNMGRGRFLFDDDINSHAHVVVLGSDLAHNLFPVDEPVGKAIKIAKRTFRVIGVLSPAGTRFFSNADDQAYIPFTTLLDMYNKDRLNFMAVKTGTLKPADAKQLIRATLRDTHNIDGNFDDLSKDDFRVATQEDTIRSANTIGLILQILLGSVASISLFVAGIGIMNIMYVTVTERTREIGLRKAIGALRRDVLRQFLFEAIILTSVAGTIGILLGVTLSMLGLTIIKQLAGGDWTFAMPWFGIFLGFSVSAAIGILFGYFPARRAANLSPIEALRYE